MDNLNNELKFDLSEKLFESMCQINSKRLSILNSSFIKLCENYPKLQELFKEELEALHFLNKKEREYRRSLESL